MAVTGVNSQTVTQLDPYYQNLINNMMLLERQPMELVSEKKDSINIRKGVYTDMNSSLETFQSKLRMLLSSSSTNALKKALSATVSGTGDSTVVTATTGENAIAGTYSLQVTHLARAFQTRGDQQASSTMALGLSGTFMIGGTETQAINSSSVNTTATGFATAAVADGQTELGRDDYFIETRMESGSWQFRVVDGSGASVSIKLAGGEGNTSTWQNISPGATFDTGRGLTIDFGADTGTYQSLNRLNGAPTANYHNLGTAIVVDSAMSLNDIATAINNASYADGSQMTASIVDNRLVIQNKNAGDHLGLPIQDIGADRVLKDIGILTEAGALKNYDPVTDAGQDAVFTINGVSIERRSNTNLSDVITDVTLNLASDAAGKSASISVSGTVTGARSAINDFLKEFNSLMTYLKNKTGVKDNGDGTYTRGALASDFLYRSLNSDLISMFTSNASNGGVFENLRQIGLEINDDMSVVVADASKLDNALGNQLSDLTKLMDAVMGKMETHISAYTGDSGFVKQSITSAEDQIELLNQRIERMETRMDARKAQLTKQFAQIQSQMVLLQYQQQSIGYMTSFLGSNFSGKY